MNSFPHTTYDVASSEEHKLYWKRKNGNNPELPMIMVNGARAGVSIYLPGKSRVRYNRSQRLRD